MVVLGMEAIKSQRALIQYGYGYGIGSSNVVAVATPVFPASGHGRGSFATTTTFQAGRLSHSSAAAAFCLPVSQDCSFAPVSTGGKYKMQSCLTRGRSFNTTITNWLCSSASASSSSSSPSRGGKFRAAFGGNWSSTSSSSSCMKDFRELLVVASQPLAYRGKTFSVAITTTPFELRHTRGELHENILYKILKISASSIFSWLKRKRRVLEIRPDKHLSTGYHWKAPALCRFFRFTSSTSMGGAQMYFHRLPRHQRSIRSTSDFYNSYSSVSSQAEGSETLENATLMDQQQRRSNDGSQDFLATGYGWRVRDAVRGELQELIRVADIQTSSFHERSALFDDLLYKIFHAEVLSSLQYKTKHFAPDRYACLLAERDLAQLDSSSEVQCEAIEQTIVGAVDVTVFSERDILCHLPGAEEYVYISGMAVDSNYRRRSVATLLLEACLNRALDWGFDYLVLHAYEDDFRARNLYSRAGYHTVAADPAWMTKFLGRRRRVVLAKSILELRDSA